MSELGMTEVYGGLRPGVNVDIRRTDGRVHPAVVTAVHSRLVNVEWFENGQTKGKDVDRVALVGLNPELIMSPPPGQLPPPPPPQRPEEQKPSGNKRKSTVPLIDAEWPHRRETRDTTSSLPCSMAHAGTAAVTEEDALRERNITAAISCNEVDLCHKLSRELEQAARMNLAGTENKFPMVTTPDFLNQQQEAEALAQLLRRYRAVVDVSDLWMTTDVRLLTRLLSTRALEDDTWLRELEDLVLVKMELLAGLRDSVARLRKIRSLTGTVAARTVDVDCLRKR
ncbi:kinesin-like protein KIF2C [Ixodes scapularis]|uniref:kinesin-like protein KIF2C n=1 Tax=Ixodes scapularis TaxID=6945 RepID=UPI001A9EA07C|nr:kinesin-like protein KIF2C [Ixodes scapularis]